MGHVKVLANVYDASSEEVYATLCDFSSYREHSDAVREVTLSNKDDDQNAMSSWEVNFRKGILRWTERDIFFPDRLMIEFEQVDGDPECFSGSWAVSPSKNGCQVCFTAEFDMGIPSLSDIIEPIAEQALSHNVRSILKGVLSNRIEFIEPQKGQKFAES